MKVSNLLGHVNQFIINDWDAYYFQSYDTMMCKVVQGDLGDNFTMLENYWSATTGKHMRAFLEEVYLWDIVADLIYEHKVFKNLKDFMERVSTVKLFMGDVTVTYKAHRGETKTETFTCKAP